MASRCHFFRTVLRAATVTGLLISGLSALAVFAAEAVETSPTVIRIQVDSIIHPVAATYIADAVAEADRIGAAALVIELDTPGGLLTSTREISEAMLGAETPVVVYVSPSGAQAGSAGFFLLMAADIAAMAPGTNAGAAHPVGGQGEEIEGPLGDKVKEDAAATIRSLAHRNGRNIELAEAGVVESRSFTAEEALEGGLIDLIAPGVAELLARIDGREIVIDGVVAKTVGTSGSTIQSIELGPFQRFLSALAHPNIAYILMTLGGLGLYFELSNPGAIFPGVVGVICLILAFFALSVLPVNYAGIALLILALILFIAEVKVTSYGLLTVAGVLSMIVGSMMLFKSADPALRVSLEVILAVAAVTSVTIVFLMSMALRAARSQVTTGLEGLVNEHGVARSALTPEGKVFVHGEIWNAIAKSPVDEGRKVVVVGADGLTLHVQPAGSESPEPAPPAEENT